MHPEPASGRPLLEQAASWLLEVLSRLFGPIPGSKVHDEAFCKAVKDRNDELNKPEGQRDAALLQELTEQMLRLRLERCQVRGKGLLPARRRPHRPIRPALCRAQRLICLAMQCGLTGSAGWLPTLQVLQRDFRASHLVFSQPPDCKCCSDCLVVRQRLAACCQATAAWYDSWEQITSQQLQAVQRGEPPPALPVPPFELQLPPGVPEQLPPSVDRCSRCQHNLDYVCGLGLAWRLRGRGVAPWQQFCNRRRLWPGLRLWSACPSAMAVLVEQAAMQSSRLSHRPWVPQLPAVHAQGATLASGESGTWG